MRSRSRTATRLDVSGVILFHGTGHVAEKLGVSRRTVERWVHSGVDVYTADKIAIKVAGDHPEFVWGLDWRNAEGGDPA